MSELGGVMGRLEELRTLVSRLSDGATSPLGQRRLREAQALLHAVEDAIRMALHAEAIGDKAALPKTGASAPISGSSRPAVRNPA